MRPYDSIILTEDLSETLRTGTEGAIVESYPHANDVFMVELFDTNGNTLDVVDVYAHQMTVTLVDFQPEDRIALLNDIPSHKVLRGQVGVIKSRISVGRYIVEFADNSGHPYAELTIHAGNMLLLHWQPVQV